MYVYRVQGKKGRLQLDDDVERVQAQREAKTESTELEGRQADQNWSERERVQAERRKIISHNWCQVERVQSSS